MDVTLHITLPTFHSGLFQKNRETENAKAHTYQFYARIKGKGRWGDTRESISVNKRIVNDRERSELVKKNR